MALVGTIVEDRIFTPGGEVVRSLGGLAYSVAAMSALGGERFRVLPVARLADDLSASVLPAWHGLGNVELDALIPWRGPGSRVELRYVVGGSIGGDREERLSSATPELGVDELAPALAADAMLVNCITGPVLDPPALARLTASPKPVHLDVHSMVLGTRDDGTRYPRRPALWQEWLSCADTVQANEYELAILAAAAAGREPDPVPADRTVLEEFAMRQVAGAGRPQTVVCTRGERGAEAHTGTGKVSVRAPRVRVVDPTGAGDTFGAAWLVALLRGAGLDAALGFAVAAASASCTLAGTEALAGLRNQRFGLS